jgi:hypothetical protein
MPERKLDTELDRRFGGLRLDIMGAGGGDLLASSSGEPLLLGPSISREGLSRGDPLTGGPGYCSTPGSLVMGLALLMRFSEDRFIGWATANPAGPDVARVPSADRELPCDERVRLECVEERRRRLPRGVLGEFAVKARFDCDLEKRARSSLVAGLDTAGRTPPSLSVESKGLQFKHRPFKTRP